MVKRAAQKKETVVAVEDYSMGLLAASIIPRLVSLISTGTRHPHLRSNTTPTLILSSCGQAKPSGQRWQSLLPPSMSTKSFQHKTSSGRESSTESPAAAV